MSEDTSSDHKFPEQLSDILLVLDKEKKKIRAVKGMSEEGELETVAPTKKNQNQFMRVDKHGDFISNFFSNFYSQMKDPTHFSFFKVPKALAVETANKIQKHLKVPTKEGSQLMQQYEATAGKDIKQENHKTMKTKQKTTQAETNGYRYQPEQIDWETMSNLGLSKEHLEKKNLLEPLLKGYKTNQLVPVSVNLGTAVLRMDARLSLQQNKEGKVIGAIHGIRKEPNLDFPFFGHEFSKEDKENLLKKGNMGRVVDLTNPKTGETIPSIISLDRLTNELVALRTEWMKIPNEIKGIALNEAQKQTLQEGKSLHLEGMISKKGTQFNATVQFNADKRYVEFLFDRNNVQKQVQDNQQNRTHEVPKTFRGKELTDGQYEKYKDGQTVYVSGLTDKKGQKYQGYITYNKETSKTGFSFKKPNKIKEQAQPTEAYETQKAVNSEGKTNETTKNIKKPLKSGEKNPDSKEPQEQRQTPKAPAKFNGRKM
ncbi:DUF3945 domain-containing protein [Salegentibacter sp. Hel_I_6]|uniref:DUF3945 domain-containing protein n=1 Tax=Salegentibacter sp. Hel_I_6 TaxID=1250278 RepID=UPI00055A36A4|nr:DUF3945 domain-containing protein [Salegentibacter sp. Hel_I_6]